ncbi:hypothetical protein HZC00_02615 [Candidatus Kaiserbacteria bacterium]|nr:hypothetical protein [Candidatus Kaiserbacteria bacterium]
MKRSRVANCLLGAVMIAGVAGGGYFSVHQGSKALVFSPPQMLSALWNSYKKVYVASDGRTIDPGHNNTTTSEGQSYTMMRAVWMGDKETFDTSWGWTHRALERPDHVFAWLYGKQGDGTYGILADQGGMTSASDADVDIALSLVFAYARWQDPAYLESASTTIAAIWNAEVITIQGTPYLTADSLEKTSTSPWAAVNPSYLNPAAFRIFARIDTAHPWLELVDSSYDLIARASDSTLDKKKSADLPPDWIRIHKQTGAIEPLHDTPETTTDFGYNALRLPWRLTLDWQWFHDSHDQAILKRFSFLSEEWNKNSFLYATYAHDGSTATGTAHESPAMYGGTIGYFMTVDPSLAPVVYTTKLESLFSPDNNTWNTDMSYYGDNWAWFGIALYNDLLPNIAASLPRLSLDQASL